MYPLRLRKDQVKYINIFYFRVILFLFGNGILVGAWNLNGHLRVMIQFGIYKRQMAKICLENSARSRINYWKAQQPGWRSQKRRKRKQFIWGICLWRTLVLNQVYIVSIVEYALESWNRKWKHCMNIKEKENQGEISCKLMFWGHPSVADPLRIGRKPKYTWE